MSRNKSLVDKINSALHDLNCNSLIDIGTCNLHVIHNGFHAGIASVDKTWGIEELLSDTYYFFKKYPSRSQDFDCIQQSLNCEKKAFKRFVSNRWLSAGPVCNRVIENWAGLKEFFLKKEHSKSIKESAAFCRIASKLQEGDVTLARLHFVSSIAGLFEPILTKLQTESTLIHVLLEELCHLLRLLLQRFVKHDLLTDKSDKQLKDVKLEPRSVEMCDFGEKTKELLRKLKKDTNPRVALLQKDMLKFLQSSAERKKEIGSTSETETG